VVIETDLDTPSKPTQRPVRAGRVDAGLGEVSINEDKTWATYFSRAIHSLSSNHVKNRTAKAAPVAFLLGEPTSEPI
jgi:hypothetical protein